MTPGVPAISVYMSVHDAAPYLDACLASIAGQSEPDFEFLVADDGSTDGSREIVRRWTRDDARIRLVDNDRRLGLIAGLNLAVGQARAPLCARMDADDIAHADRLRRQRRLLDADASAAVVGTLADAIDREGRPLRPRDRWRLVRPSPVPPFAHATVMFRRALFVELGGYREAAWLWEDADLCARMAARGRVMILPDALYTYRIHAHSTTLGPAQDRVRAAIASMLEATGASTERRRAAATRYYVGASHLWAGSAPSGLRDVPWWPPSFGALKVLALATWGRVSPRTLRAALRACIRARDAAAGLWLRGGAAIEWRPQSRP